MKKTLTLSALLLMICLKSFAQTIVNPQVNYPENPNATVAKVETDAQFTVVSFEFYAPTDKSWADVNKEFYIQTDQGNAHYNYVKAENITISPKRTIIAKAGDKLLFKVYFQKIPQTAKSIDIIERAGPLGSGNSYFNFYGVSLTQSVPAGTTQRVKITDVVLLPPPPVENTGVTVTGGVTDINSDSTNGMANAMNMMGPMINNMATSMMDAQLNYYKQPGKIAEVARLNKQYFDALVKEGFSDDQAIKIVTSEGLLPKASSIGGK
jgi:hypothetical protein